MAGYVFFLVASWYLCGLLGAPSFALRPELMQRDGTLAGAISLGSTVSISLVMGWLLTFLAHHVEALGGKKNQKPPEQRICNASAGFDALMLSPLRPFRPRARSHSL